VLKVVNVRYDPYSDSPTSIKGEQERFNGQVAIGGQHLPSIELSFSCLSNDQLVDRFALPSFGVFGWRYKAVASLWADRFVTCPIVDWVVSSSYLHGCGLKSVTISNVFLATDEARAMTSSEGARLTWLGRILLGPTNLRLVRALSGRPTQAIPLRRSSIPLRASSVPISIVAVAEDVPEAPPNDPIVPAAI
jgi:hypothetical protein